MKKSKYLAVLCAVVIMITALAVPASAAGKSVAEQMAANSAAWHIANAAGDKATCEKLHQANVALANSAASGGGSATFNASSGTWNITTSSGSTISSSGSSNGKTNTAHYTTTTSSGRTSSTSVDSYSGSSISSYKSNGGTNSGLKTAYNNDAYNVSATGNYGTNNAVSTAAAEAAVAKELLGLTTTQANKLQADLEASKNAYVTAKNAYDNAVKSGDTTAAEAARAAMDAAHNKAQATRDSYGYSGDNTEYKDGGYYYGDGKPVSNGGGFYVSDIKPTYKVTASCNEGGTITPSGEVSIKKGESKEFVIAPNTGYKIKSVVVDGSDKGALTSYTFTNVTAAHTIKATFEKLTYTISASGSTGGTISPSGSVKVEYGSSKTFTITPAEGYKIEQVMVDGQNKGAVSSYTFTDIQGAHSISASFVPSGKVGLGTPEVTDANGDGIGGAASGESIKSGYGIFVKAPLSYEGVTDVKLVMTYNFGSGSKSVTLEETGRGTFEYPVNAASPNRSRCVYIPVAAQDGDYTLTFTVTAKNAAGELLTQTRSARVVVHGNMYEDDFTGDA